jgi:hypothetical protein
LFGEPFSESPDPMVFSQARIDEAVRQRRLEVSIGPSKR